MSKQILRKVTNVAVDRRTFLRGAGVVMGLPWLEAMTSSAMAQETVAVPTRLACIFFPNGAIMPDWTPEGTGKDFQLSKTLSSLAPVREDCLFLSGLTHDKARANGDGGGDHARNSASFLTASQPRKTGGADIFVGTSVDQVAAAQVGKQTHLPSLELGTEAGRSSGVCDSGYSCAYQSNISWKSPSQPMAKEVIPRQAFERLFGMSAQDAKKRQERDFYRSSILDVVMSDAKGLQQQLGKTDREKLDEYFTSVREIEQRIGNSSPRKQVLPPEFNLPEGVPADIVQHIRLMYDIMAVAFQTDTTRVSTFMLADGGSNRSYSNLEIKGGHHQLSHHRNENDKVQALQKIDQFLVGEFSRFIQKLKSIPEGTGSLLDHSMIVYGSGLSDANRHDHHNLPIVLAGKGSGTLTTGRHLVYEKETPMANLYVSLLNRMGCQLDTFGDSTGSLQDLGA
ncbi:MAG: DUF1552 domain-containing protein [Planctomycetaceae bacterium]|nr:DUF1552 domain-containing protein [Planctomycetaceae bacterium]